MLWTPTFTRTRASTPGANTTNNRLSLFFLPSTANNNRFSLSFALPASLPLPVIESRVPFRLSRTRRPSLTHRQITFSLTPFLSLARSLTLTSLPHFFSLTPISLSLPFSSARARVLVFFPFFLFFFFLLLMASTAIIAAVVVVWFDRIFPSRVKRVLCILFTAIFSRHRQYRVFRFLPIRPRAFNRSFCSHLQSALRVLPDHVMSAKRQSKGKANGVSRKKSKLDEDEPPVLSEEEEDDNDQRSDDDDNNMDELTEDNASLVSIRPTISVSSSVWMCRYYRFCALLCLSILCLALPAYHCLFIMLNNQLNLPLAGWSSFLCFIPLFDLYAQYHPIIYLKNINYLLLIKIDWSRSVLFKFLLTWVHQ